MDGTLLSLISFTCTIKHCIRIANNTASMAICHVSFFPKAIYGIAFKVKHAYYISADINITLSGMDCLIDIAITVMFVES